MADQLTDAELVRLGDRARNGLIGTSDRAQLLELVAEVREHRAARTLTDDEQGAMSDARWRLDQGEPMTPHAAHVYLTRLVAIIDRITKGADCG